ncbi:MAG: hypothetical protein FJZ63_06165, partial [Chlamydiae bacterium]|nr:hypothetical protein [Chlamydiota bacterium]
MSVNNDPTFNIRDLQAVQFTLDHEGYFLKLNGEHLSVVDKTGLDTSKVSTGTAWFEEMDKNGNSIQDASLPTPQAIKSALALYIACPLADTETRKKIETLVETWLKKDDPTLPKTQRTEKEQLAYDSIRQRATPYHPWDPDKLLPNRNTPPYYTTPYCFVTFHEKNVSGSWVTHHLIDIDILGDFVPPLGEDVFGSKEASPKATEQPFHFLSRSYLPKIIITNALPSPKTEDTPFKFVDLLPAAVDLTRYKIISSKSSDEAYHSDDKQSSPSITSEKRTSPTDKEVEQAHPDTNLRWAWGFEDDPSTLAPQEIEDTTYLGSFLADIEEEAPYLFGHDNPADSFTDIPSNTSRQHIPNSLASERDASAEEDFVEVQLDEEIKSIIPKPLPAIQGLPLWDSKDKCYYANSPSTAGEPLLNPPIDVEKTPQYLSWDVDSKTLKMDTMLNFQK